MSKDFLTLAALFIIIRRPEIASKYDGTQLKRQMQQHWTRDLDITSAILANYHDIIGIFAKATELKLI